MIAGKMMMFHIICGLALFPCFINDKVRFIEIRDFSNITWENVLCTVENLLHFCKRQSAEYNQGIRVDCYIIMVFFKYIEAHINICAFIRLKQLVEKIFVWYHVVISISPIILCES